MTWFIGVDVGGTFTDFHAFDVERGREHVFKTPSTPDNPADAILKGLGALCAEAGIDAAAITRLAHGVPVGGELDYLDDGTLTAALRARRSL